MTESSGLRPLIMRIGHRELIVRQRYEVLSITNDFLIAVWFIVGSVLFFSADTTEAGVWCFLLGSVELAIRPMIRLVRHIHLIHTRRPESGQDF